MRVLAATASQPDKRKAGQDAAGGGQVPGQQVVGRSQGRTTRGRQKQQQKSGKGSGGGKAAKKQKVQK